jgi:hypothetical protein
VSLKPLVTDPMMRFFPSRMYSFSSDMLSPFPTLNIQSMWKKRPVLEGNLTIIFGNPTQFSRRFCHLVCILQMGDKKLTIKQLIEEQRRRLRSANPVERFAAALLIPGVLAKRLRLLGDPRLAQLLEEEVWSRMNLLAPESTICLAAVDRLRGHVNRQHKPNESEGGI